MYLKYKDSGVMEIGEIPLEWNIDRLVALGTFSKGKNITKSDLVDSGYPCILYSQIYTNFDRIFTSVCSYIDDKKFLDSTKIKKDKFLFTSSGETVEDIGKCVLYNGEEEIALGGDIVVYSILDSNKFYNKFLSYVFNSDFFQYQKSANSNGDIVVHIYEKQLREIRFPYPSFMQQKLISNYLDIKTQKIDSLISLIEDKIKILKEKKTSLIHQIVTKGLDSTSDMKDSGISWIGKIPKHWDIFSLKFSTKITRGKFTHRPRNDPQFYNGNYPFIQTGDISGSGKYLSKYSQTLNEKGYLVSKEFPMDTLVMGISANIGNVSILKIACCFPDSIVGFEPKNDWNSEFLYYLFTSMTEEFERNAIVSTQLNLNVDRLGDIKIPKIPLNEQLKIVEVLDEKVNQFDLLIHKEIERSTFLKEYRQSLISSVVTGKIRITEESV
tara:strand:- start:3241 stop:4560 length:1320 start_codon:yes stop_codon:yes gene_type:complete